MSQVNTNDRQGVTANNIRVLHVDDEPGLAEMAGEFLEREDDCIQVEIATNASEGLDSLAGGDFDCIVSDYDMPEQNGIEFLKTVREEYPDLPFILYTGKGSEAVASDAISAGVTEYLQKERGTSQYAVLANRIRNAVEKYYAQNELADREQRLNLFFEQSPLGVIEWTEDFDLLRLNDAAEDILGYSSDDLVGKSWTAIVPESERAKVDDVVSDLLQNTGGYHSVNENIRKDGEQIVCEWHNWVVTDDDDEVIAVFSQFEDITEDKERERELERYEAYLQGSTDVITVLDESGTIKYESPSVSRILGYDPGKLVGQNGFNFIHPDDVDDVYATFSDLVSEPEESVTVECRFRTVDGEWRWLEVRATNHLNDEMIEGIVTNNRDITQRKEQEQKRTQLISRVTDAIVEVDSNWQFTLVNEQAEELYDMDEESLLGQNFWDVFEEARGTRFEEEYRHVMETREPTSFTEYYAGLDGWFDIEVYPKDDGGIEFYFIEITEQRQRQEELEQQYERFKYVGEVADIGYWEIDTQTPEPHDVILSDGVYDVHDLPPDEPFDLKQGIQFYHPDDREQMREAVEKAISDGVSYDLEARLITATGRERWVHTVGEPVTCDGEVVHVRGILQDVTERKQKEQSLARQNARLDEFASIVSHDLRNPLNVAEGRLELAQDECESAHLDDAANALQRSQTLIDDLLTLAREGKELGTVESVELANLVETCWQTVSTNGARLDIDTEQTILADRSRLRQLVENLIRNAVVHGGDDVTVTIGRTEDGFYIADDGLGIPETEREQVFEAGYSRLEESTGFGLNIVREIADAHGWDITLSDSETGGTRFEISGVESAT